MAETLFRGEFAPIHPLRKWPPTSALFILQHPIFPHRDGEKFCNRAAPAAGLSPWPVGPTESPRPWPEGPHGLFLALQPWE